MKLKVLQTFDWVLIIAPILLLAAGIATIYSITISTPKVGLATNQLFYGIIGIILMFIFTFLDYRMFKSLAWPLFFIGLILLLLVAFFGIKILGAKRWLSLGFLQIQPSEIFKPIMILLLARLASTLKEFRLPFLLVFLLAVALPVILVMFQPDLGTAIILLVVALAIIIFSKIPRYYLLIALGLGLIALPIVLFHLAPYQRERLYVFLNPSHDPLGAGYNVNQSLIAVGSGGLWGRGLGSGPQSQLNFLPIAHTDFIFAGFAEATGFAGSSLLLLIFAVLIYRILKLVTLASDSFGSFLALGIGVVFIFQIIINIGMNLGLAPITGIPLPFVSYGGSALISNFIAVGILQSIYLRHKKITFG